jgi:hypothetical protein
MSGEAIVGMWLLFAGAVGCWRTVFQFRRAPDSMLWKVEGILSLIALGLGAIFVSHAVASGALR